MLKVEALKVRYGDVLAVDGLTFQAKGEVYCLLGPNGAGKTSTVKAIMDAVPYEGYIEVYGVNAKEPVVKNLIGYVPEQVAFFEYMKPKELIEFMAALRGLNDLSTAQKLVEAFNLSNVDQPLYTLSMGTRQKVAIVLALMHSPKLLILDEAFNGLDVFSAKLLKEIVTNQVRGGGTVLFSTHVMEIAEKMCTRIGIINRGKLVSETTPSTLREHGESLEDFFLTTTGLDESLREVLKGLE
ncbi:hypothetical protein HS1genome_2248 [Sulfodiicoccus acidiphilus]|uniref:ABC transporter domain-containing protein n=1 Tax=Sulfodiicoccus acidiphilus TaxID=1670455 RepID=A0A348B6Q7_9CREN|nr:ABC transporter ATP-binding protein [Sulfodiicoccus acidiphilus]BBD73859.1 hypothetical protein HS1genome_2248 [Sulfodiicoccus acidiphilus]GGT96276.1 hypothetical protein GCM10007116_12280 [Sulfodiicoccus acidiphilus]